MNEDSLVQIGLSGSEARVYLSLLSLGASPVGGIAQKSGMHRRNVYDSLEHLVGRGLVSYILQNNRRCYEAADPACLEVLIRDERARLDVKEKQLRELVPLLHGVHSRPLKRQEARIFRGKQGIKSIYEDLIESGVREYWVLATIGYAPRVLEYYYSSFTKRRLELGIRLKIIFTESARTTELARLPLSEIRYIPDEYSSPLSILIYGDSKVALNIWSSEPIALLIENKEVSEGYKKHFKLIWKNAKK